MGSLYLICRSRLLPSICRWKTNFIHPMKAYQLVWVGNVKRNYSKYIIFNSIRSDQKKIWLATAGVGLCSTVLFGLGRRSHLVALSSHPHQNKVPAELITAESDSRNESIFIVRWIFAVWETLLTLLRLIRLTIVFTPVFVTWPITLIFPSFQPKWWQILLTCMEASGPIYIKLGQWASSRRDIFSDEFCDRFSKLQRNTSSHSWYFTLERMRQAFGDDWRDYFVMFDPVPIGSGCVAQIHKAYIRTDKLSNYKRKNHHLESFSRSFFNKVMEFTGFADFLGWKDPVMLTDDVDCDVDKLDSTLLPVAVKILHPGIHEQLRRDLLILNTGARLLQLLAPSTRWLNLHKCYLEFSDTMHNQIDLTTEATNLETFQTNFQGIENVCFPKPVRPFVSPTVLIETYEPGEPISSYLRSKDYSDELKKNLADIGMKSVLKMVFSDNFVHCDLHPGNIHVQMIPPKTKFYENNVFVNALLSMMFAGKPLMAKELEPKLVFLDCGLAAHLTDQNLVYFSGVFSAIVLGKAERVGELFLLCSQHECSNEEEFKAGMASLVHVGRKGLMKMREFNANLLLSQMFNLLVQYKVRLESGFISVILAIAVVEGLGHSLDPDMNLLEKARPFVLGL